MNTVQLAESKITLVNKLVELNDMFPGGLNMERVLYPDDFLLDNELAFNAFGPMDQTPMGELAHRASMYVDTYKTSQLAFIRILNALKEV